MNDYQAVIDKALALAEEAARLTATPWDDTIAQAARAVFDRFFGAARPCEARLTTDAVAATAEAEAVPPWLIPLVVEVVKWLLSLRK